MLFLNLRIFRFLILTVSLNDAIYHYGERCKDVNWPNKALSEESAGYDGTDKAA
jgi:hypothetical protein